MLLDQIVRETGFSRERILEIIRRAPYTYQIYTIPKRAGNGVRLIEHPGRPLKVLQRWLADRVLVDLPIHECVYSYKTGVSIKEHAEAHKKTNFLLRIDLQDFFPSIKRGDVIALLELRRQSLKTLLTDAEISVVAALVCRGSAITIGAPSSPVISNAVLYDFDVAAAEMAARYAVTYTRYADDLYFSTDTPNVLTAILSEVRQLFQRLPFPRVTVNDDKIVFTSRKRKKVVTGLVITSDRKISLGRERKRYIRSLLYRFQENRLDEKEISYLKGYLSYCKDAEPEFVRSVKSKYGEALVAQVLAAPTVLRKTVHPKKNA